MYHKDMIPQFSQSERYRVNFRNLSLGLVWFVIGLFKKVRIADSLGEYADIVFSGANNITMLDAWFGSIAYSLQLYYDFSGYSEMAIGLGLMLNYNLPLNFNMPYRACSIIEFWRKWHITLSEFLKNYLYIPLGGNRNNHHLRNILLTMLLGGLWHGAGWTFILWGGLHGLFICVNHLWRKTCIVLPKYVNWLLTFNAINFAWIFFRAENMETALSVIKKLYDYHSLYIPYNKFILKILGISSVQKSIISLENVLFILVSLYVCTRIIDTEDVVSKFKPNYIWMIGIGMLAAYLLLYIGNVESQFIYFQF